MAGATGSVLTASTPTLALLACQQQVSDLMTGVDGSVLTAFISALVLLA